MKIDYLICFLFMMSAQVFGQSQVLVDQAYHAYYTEKNYPKADSLFTQLNSTNPYNHDYIVRSAFASYNSSQHEKSIDQFKKAIEIGEWPDIYAYYIAANYMKLESHEKALDWLEKSIYEYKWPDYMRLARSKVFEPLNDSLRYKRFFGKDSKVSSKTEKWGKDLEFIWQKIMLLHYDPFQKTELSVWNKQRENAEVAILQKDDRQIIVEFMKLVALAGEGHTKVLPPEEGQHAFSALPIKLYHFKNGTYIIEATEKYQHLIGNQVLSIGSKDIGTLKEQSYVYRGHDNFMHHIKINPQFLTTVETLRDMGAIVNLSDPVKLKLKKKGSIQEIELAAFEIKNLEEEKWSQNLSDVDETKLYYINKEKDFWFTDLSNRNSFYINIHYILNNDDTSFKMFVESSFAKIDSLKSKNLILDLRNCGGGNSDLNKFLIKEILIRPELNSKNSLFVLIGRETYSAAINLVADLEYRTEATFVGEPIGASPNFIGESNALQLPYSNLYLIISNRYHQGGSNNSLDKRPWIAPNIVAEFTSMDYFKIEDPGLEAIFKEIDSKSK